jgi:hypothetical protein
MVCCDSIDFNPPQKMETKKGNCLNPFILFFFCVCLSGTSDRDYFDDRNNRNGLTADRGGGGRKLYAVQESATTKKKGDPFRSVNGN